MACDKFAVNCVWLNAPVKVALIQVQPFQEVSIDDMAKRVTGRFPHLLSVILNLPNGEFDGEMVTHGLFTKTMRAVERVAMIGFLVDVRGYAGVDFSVDAPA